MTYEVRNFGRVEVGAIMEENENSAQPPQHARRGNSSPTQIRTTFECHIAATMVANRELPGSSIISIIHVYTYA